MHNLAEYIQVFRDVLGLERESDILEANSENTEEWDSYMHMELVAAIEEKFQIQFQGEDVLKFVSFEEGLSILHKKGVVCKGDGQ